MRERNVEKITERSTGKTMQLLKKHDFHFKKKWGQNFILDKNILSKIVRAAQIEPNEGVVEIGPGAGTLTRLLAEAGARVLAVEIDPALIPVLKESLEGLEVTLQQGDILKTDLDKMTQELGFSWPYKVVANLPYYITSPVLLNIIESGYHIERVVFMLQKEVAERLTATPGTKAYGAITLAVQYHMEASLLFKVPRHLFTPAPDVDSAVVVFKKKPQPAVKVDNEALMFKIIKAAFGQRRKTLSNALASLAGVEDKGLIIRWLERAGIDGQRRGETLSLQEFAWLSDTWQE